MLFDENINSNFHTDPNRLRQILLNLLANALKFTYSGKITLKLEKLACGIIKISIIDSGIGIQKKNMDKLFKRFGKLNLGEENKINSQGVGLGLSISQ